LREILFLTVNSALCGYSDWDEIVDFGHAKLRWLRQYSPYSNGIPSHDTINRVMSLISTKEFESFFVNWVKDLGYQLDGRVINIDGKSLKGSVNNSLKNVKVSEGGKQPVHLVEAWCSELGLCLGQVKTEEKSNEITAIPELLKLLDLDRCLVTIDAMGCQTAIAEQITEQGGDYLLALKSNQERLFEATSALFAAQTDVAEHEDFNEAHGRVEARKCRVLDAALLPEELRKQWPKISTLVKIEAHRGTLLKKESELSFETRYYISSREGEAAYFNAAARGHWKIENELHWRLDVIFEEDASRKQQGNAPQNMGVINRIVLNMLKNNEDKDKKVSIKRRMNKCILDDEYRRRTMLF
jgi:predicted transposase YbfD/YdcC